MYKLIIVDDEKIIRDGLCSYFKNDETCFEVAGTFDSAVKAIEFLKREKCDVVLTDIRMDDVSGLDIARFVFEEKIPAKVVLISGYGEFEYAQKALQFKVFNYLLKPVKFRQLDELCSDLKKTLDSEPKSEVSREAVGKKITLEGSDTEKAGEQLREESKTDDVMRRALRYIDENYNRDLTLGEVASSVYFSPMYFGRIFKSYVNESFTDYIIGKRIEKAKELLKDGLKVQDVSIRVGYENTKYFMRIFKKKVGITPGVYQRKRGEV